MIDSYKVIRPLLFLCKDPEKAHEKVKWLFTHEFPFSLLKDYFDYAADRLSVNIDGIQLNGPVSNAAGLDKDCEMIPGIGEIFDMVLLGTLMPYEWAGNPTPRVARNIKTRSLVNGMGFPSRGPSYTLPRIESYKGIIPISASVSVRPVEGEYQSPALQQLYNFIKKLIELPQVQMLEVNFASPNTPGLQGFFEEKTFENFTKTLYDIAGNIIPTFLKLPPYNASDIKQKDRNFTTAEIWLRYGGTGFTLTNALLITDDRMPSDKNGNRTGGLSGGELYPISIKNLQEFNTEFRKRGHRPIINYAGGAYPEHIQEILEIGRPHTIQILTPFIYEGPAIVRRIKKEMVKFLDVHHYATYQEFLKAA